MSSPATVLVFFRLALLCCALCLAIVPLAAQQAPQPLTMSAAVEMALKNYPAVAASLEQVSAASAGTRLARTAYLPRADFLGQWNRATRNNIFGLLLPQPLAVLPSISGPVLRAQDGTTVWGSATGVLFCWEPLDFGLRAANVAVAESARRRAETGVAVTRLQVAAAAADAFLAVLASDQAVLAARAGVDRARVLRDVTGTLAKNGLRPGADASRASAELALAQTELIRAEEAAQIARSALANFLGIPAAQAVPQAGALLGAPPAAPAPAENLANHPLARQQSAVVEEIKAQERVLQRSYYPRFLLAGSAYGRGTGARVDGTTGGALSGLSPNTGNWAAGISVTFPAFDFASIRARKEIELHRERAETAQYQRVLLDLRAQSDESQTRLDGARRVADNTPVQLDAARAAEQQATARYKAGLGNIAEVADAQRLLTRAETEDALAKLAVWQALLGVAAARGDLQPFLLMAR